jgi:hypothetical protein
MYDVRCLALHAAARGELLAYSHWARACQLGPPTDYTDLLAIFLAPVACMHACVRPATNVS